ncbi:Inositol hexakisphosphate and diphosphoinositol-pentakisphosphate kinase [Parelaphostrongylus tenuis]|uniref:Inositol hexakisphosphate and diphosphoinositol-pentakisphosphate kinase n=1 Tax=Parelaphostrongylus tenuis TaxID=148309 RepID=A0AAD5WMP8_PARTN|nr:Inositol hexakisphosphate and diphosphoinositol-pentakisphosphate kinase [Parelaphostrongylus tenuis]
MNKVMDCGRSLRKRENHDEEEQVAQDGMSRSKISISMGGSGGMIAYGAVDTTYCDVETAYGPLTVETYSQFSIDGFANGSSTAV